SGFFFSSRRRHTRSKRDWSSDVCSSDLNRFIQYLLRQIAVICEDYDAAFMAHPRAVAEEKLEQVLLELDELVGIATVKQKVKERSEERRVGKESRTQGWTGE